MSAPNKDYDPVGVTALKAEVVERMRDAAIAAIVSADSLESLRQVRLDHAGDRSPLGLANREIGALPPQARKDAGMRMGQARGAVSKALAERTALLEAEHESHALVAEAVDVTLPWDGEPQGARHPLTSIQEAVADIFVAMGWEVAEGPEVEAEWLNFDALNLGPDHPARTLQDTFWVTPERAAMVLRTHTSPVQARTMEKHQGRGPVKIICPGKVYRRDNDDATHSHQFTQIEGLVVDENIRMSDLKGTLREFARKMFGEGREIRFRPSFFPFTEPSVEVDVSCFHCGGHGCSVCKGTGWIEILGAGMVHPNVLEMAGFDSKKYTGFAFGMGPERIAMLKYGIDDIRHFYQNDIRFLQQFHRV